ncbi:MAG TPA: Uma2 family endonuclease [Planctomycetaceae bacterium]|nr:Uma2 family endonuclease [Planctomycetaceae bacterium]
MATTTIHPAEVRRELTVRPLVDGDHLTADEFLRRYEAMPDVNKAELIEGVVHMPSPVTFVDHGGPDFDLMTWLGIYRIHTPGVQGAGNTTIQLDLDNVPQPDAFLRILTECGGQSRVVGKYLHGGPELTAEIAASSASYDLHEKFNAYRRNGVREYVVWRVWDEAIDWFVLRSGKYEPLPLDSDGCYRSEVFPGLWLDPQALISGDMLRVESVLHRGLADAAHAAFVQELNERRKASSSE